MDLDQQKCQSIMEILQNLGFDLFLKKYSPRTIINSESLQKLTSFQFAMISYFLFYKLNANACHQRFRSVFPPRDVQQESEFRRLTMEWLNELSQTIDPLIKIAKIPAIHYQRLKGSVFIEQMLNFAMYVLHKYVTRKHANLADQIEKEPDMLERIRKENDQLERELSRYEQLVDDKLKHFEAKQNEPSLSKSFGDIEPSEVDQINQELSNELINHTKRIKETLATYENYKYITNLDEHAIYLKNLLTNVDHLLKQLKELSSFNINLSELIGTHVQLEQFIKTHGQLMKKMDDCQTKIEELEQKQAKLKEEIFGHERFRYCKQILIDHVKQFKDLDLNLKNT